MGECWCEKIIFMNNIRKKIAFITLGCKTNQYDTQALIDLAKKKDYEIVDFKDRADVYVVNSCAVTENAITKSRKKINQAQSINLKAKIVLCGCWPQTEVKGFPNVSVVSGVNKRKEIFSLLEEGKVQKINKFKDCQRFEEMPIDNFFNRSRATVKVQEGCRQFCSYCIIPYARGHLKSRDLKKIIKQVEKLVKNNYKEVVLTGTHLGLYGIDLKDKINLTNPLKELVKIKDLRRIRLSSIEVNEVTAELIGLIKKEKKICNHLHIPLQSGTNKILKLMNRPYNTEKFLRKINKIRKATPDISITTDVIVGFPNETEKDFQETYKFCQKVNFSKIHVFSFSKRKGTPAYNMKNQIEKGIIKKRSSKLRKLSEKLENDYAKKFINKTMEVLSQGKKDGFILGLTDNYLNVFFKGAFQDDLLKVKIKKILDNKLIGEIKL